MNETEKRRKFIIDITYFAILITLFYIFMHFGFGLCFPFIFAFFIAICLQKPVKLITKKTRLNRGVVSTVLVLLIVILLLLVISLIGARLVTEFKGFFAFLLSKFENIPAFIVQIQSWFKHNLGFLPDSIKTTMSLISYRTRF